MRRGDQLRGLQKFGAVESWSGYFVATDPSGYHVLQLGSPEAQAKATVPRGEWLADQQKTWPSLIAFFVGNQDNRFLDMNRQFNAALDHSHVAHTFRVYPGGHSASLWHSEAPHWLGMALDALRSEARDKR